jgi:hypothetical protein
MSCYYYIYVDDNSEMCIDQSGVIDITNASPDLNPGTLFFLLNYQCYLFEKKRCIGQPNCRSLQCKIMG